MIWGLYDQMYYVYKIWWNHNSFLRGTRDEE